MTIELPTADDVRAAAAHCGLSLNVSEVESFRRLMQPYVEAYNVVAQLPVPRAPIRYPRGPVTTPRIEDNRHNAWYVKASIPEPQRAVSKASASP